jgi:hypothetical protein
MIAFAVKLGGRFMSLRGGPMILSRFAMACHWHVLSAHWSAMRIDDR